MILSALMCLPLLGASSKSAPQSTPTPRSMSPVASRVLHRTAPPPHIMVVMMENQSYDQVSGNRAAPYINSLANTYLRATNSYARAHNSLPNYLEMISGSAFTQSGTTNDCTPSSCGPIGGTNLADQLDAAKIQWRAFMGAMPSECLSRDAGGGGGYVVRHNPFVYFPQGRTSPGCGNDLPAQGLLVALKSPTPPSFVFYSPSICQDGGQDAACSTLANGDRFLAGQIPAIMATPWYRDGGTIILTWDEGANSDASGRYGDNGGHVLTVVVSARTKHHITDRAYVDTAGILRSVEGAYALRYLRDAAKPATGSLPVG